MVARDAEHEPKVLIEEANNEITVRSYNFSDRASTQQCNAHFVGEQVEPVHGSERSGHVQHGSQLHDEGYGITETGGGL
jgi:hypothetical protein